MEPPDTVEAEPVQTNNSLQSEPTPRQTRRRIIARARWAEITLGVVLVLYAILAMFAQRYAYFHWDLSLGGAIQSIDAPGFRAMMVGVSALGSGWLPFSIVILTSVSLIAVGYRVEGFVCGIGVGLGVLVNIWLKWLIGRPRPVEPLVHVTTRVLHESFPSGHVSFFVEFFGFLLFLTYVLTRPGLFRRVSYVVLWVLLALVGVSRIYLGAHWPSDVVGAYLAGGLWLMLMIEVYRRIARE